MSNPYIQDLPARPDLEQQKTRAKELLKALQAGDPTALDRVRQSHPRRPDVTPEEAAGLKLADAQWVIAREYGFTSWARLKAHIEERRKPVRHRAFENDIQYYRDRAGGFLSTFSTGERNAVRLAQRFLPALQGRSETEAAEAKLTPADAELILAKEHGFEDWPALEAHVTALVEGCTIEPFKAAFDALRDGDEAGFAALLETHPDLALAQGTNGNNLLQLALSFRRFDAMRLLLKKGADPNQPNNKGWTALHAAAYAGSRGDEAPWLAAIEALLAAGADPDAEAYGDGGTPLAVALFWGRITLAERLAKEGVTPLNLRVASGLGRVELMAAMFEDGRLKPEAMRHREFHRPHSGFPPWRPSEDPQEGLDEALNWASRSGRIAAMAFLIDHGARIDAMPYNGTALLWAIHNDEVEAVGWLLDHGADVNRRANFGGVKGVPPLHQAAWSGALASAKLLLDRGADLMAYDSDKLSHPWGFANYHGHPDVRDAIAEFGAPRNIFVAILADRLDDVRRHIAADPGLLKVTTELGETPLAFAERYGKTAIAEVLRSAGA